MVKLNEKLLSQSINRIEISDAATAILNQNEINTLRDLCGKSKKDLKKIEITQKEIDRIDIDLQLIGLRLKNSL